MWDKKEKKNDQSVTNINKWIKTAEQTTEREEEVLMIKKKTESGIKSDI